jgi:hypothetical protein
LSGDPKRGPAYAQLCHDVIAVADLVLSGRAKCGLIESHGCAGAIGPQLGWMLVIAVDCCSGSVEHLQKYVVPAARVRGREQPAPSEHRAPRSGQTIGAYQAREASLAQALFYPR